MRDFLLNRFVTAILPIIVLILGFGVHPDSELSAKSKSLRRIKLKVVADHSFAAQGNWERKAQKYLTSIVTDLKYVLGTNIEIVGYETWEHPRDLDNLYLLASNMVENVDPGPADAIIGFTFDHGRRSSSDYHTGGVTIPFRGTLIRTYKYDSLRNSFIPNVMIHEFIHLFGGVHVYDGSLMSPAFRDTIDLVLDPLNQKIMALTRNIDFKERYYSLDDTQVRQLIDLYRRAVANGNHEVPTYLELAAMCERMGAYNDAIEQYRRVVELNPTMLYAWLAMGECYAKSDRPEGKIDVYEEAAGTVAEKDVIYGELAVLYYNSGQYRAAYRSARRAKYYGAKIDPNLWRELRSKM